VADAFKDAFNSELIEGTSLHLSRAWPEFDADRFERLAKDGLLDLELKARAAQIGRALLATLPTDFEVAAAIIEHSLHPDVEPVISAGDLNDGGIHGWAIVPLGYFVAERGISSPERGLQTLKALTKRFTSEDPIRRFIIEHSELTLATLAEWVCDVNHHVRRLVSEGTRPRLPWSERLPTFVADPSPILPLLRALRDDSSEYVRRSVANNLNDISKDHSDLIAELAGEWLEDASPQRRRLVEHACRSLVKAGHRGALEALGYRPPELTVRAFRVLTLVVRFGKKLEFELELASTATEPQRLVPDYVIHHRKANGTTSPKVFKWKKLTLAAGGAHEALRRHSIRPISTRRYYGGRHRVEVVANGSTLAGGDFELEM
jgi:3-methyladenine DNA glycosylase AlkC